MPVSKETDFNLRVLKNILEGFHLKKKSNSLYKCFSLGYI